MSTINRYSPNLRASWHDYDGGMYFVTFCTREKEPYFGDISDGKMNLTEIGVYANEQFSNVSAHYPYSEVPLWVVMPNHIHALISLLGENNLSKVVGAWKSYSAHVLNRQRGVKGHLWHEDFYNRIIRTADDYDRVKMYIWNNPDNAGLHKWPWRWITHNEQMMEGQR